MQINVTRSVVVSTTTGLRHFMPGLLVDIPQAEVEQILRQQAGNSVADRSVVALLDDTTRKKNRRDSRLASRKRLILQPFRPSLPCLLTPPS